MAGDVKGFLEACRRVGEALSKHAAGGEFIPIFTHDDPDGITAGAILGKALIRLNGRFLIRIIDRIEENLLSELQSSTSYKVYVFSEIGSGYLDLLKPLASKAEVIVMDHHKPSGKADHPNLTHLNPHDYGIDGASEISGSAVCYFVAKAINPKNVDLAPLAIIGALGDLQDKNSERRLTGLNQMVVEDAKQARLLETSRDLLFYGRETRPVHKALASTMNPFIPGLSGQEDKCYGFLVNLGVRLMNGERWRLPSELSWEEKEKIFSEITAYLASLGFPSSTILQLIGEVYTLVEEDRWTPLRDAREYASLLNACSKMGKPSLALAICLGERGETLEEAQKILNEYRRTLSEVMGSLIREKHRIKTLKNIYLIECYGIVDEHKLSPVASLLSSSGTIDSKKPLMALTDAGEGEVKASARASQNLVELGVNLGEILRAAAEAVGGRGGGHSVAAGATIPKALVEKFIDMVDRLVGESIGEG